MVKKAILSLAFLSSGVWAMETANKQSMVASGADMVLNGAAGFVVTNALAKELGVAVPGGRKTIAAVVTLLTLGKECKRGMLFDNEHSKRFAQTTMTGVAGGLGALGGFLWSGTREGAVLGGALTVVAKNTYGALQPVVKSFFGLDKDSSL